MLMFRKATETLPVILWLSTVIHIAPGVPADDWPQWRGPRRDGVWRETGIVERFTDETLPALWRTPIGAGYAGPAVAGGRVFVLDKTEDGERVLSLDARSGRILWAYEYPARYRGIGYPAGPRCTPTVVDGRVYAVGAMGHLHALDAGSGEVLWARDYVKDYGLSMPTWGVASAPLVDGERLITLVGGADGSMLVAFQKDTGAVLWRALETQPLGYSPPVIFEVGGSRQLIQWLPERVVSLNPRNGDVFWKQPFTSKHGLTVATPVFDDDRLFVSTFYNGPLMLRLSPDRPEASVIWRGTSDSEMESETDGLHCMISTPVLDGSELYGVCSYGAFRCLDANTGERLWETYEPTGNGRWWNAFLIRNGDRFFIANEQGELIIANLSRDGYDELSRTKLLDPTNRAQGRDVVWSHPAFADRHIFARNDREIICASLAAASPESSDGVVVLPETGSALGALRDGETYVQLAFIGWGPGWQWLGFRSRVEEESGRSRMMGSATVTASGARVSFDATAEKTGPRSLQVDVEVKTDRDTPLTCLAAALEVPEKRFEGGKVRVSLSGGGTREINLPLGRREIGKKVERLELVDAAGEETVISLSPPCEVTADNALRILLAGSRLAADEPERAGIEIEFPRSLTFYPDKGSIPEEPGFNVWFPFQPTGDPDRPSEIAMENWIEAPAGKHGRILREEDRLIYNGRPIKLWGLNLCYGACAPDRELAERRARFYPRWGINAVRLHKYADGPGWAGIQSESSFAAFDAGGLDRMDYFVAQLKKHGIYVKLSAHFGALKAGPADRSVVPYIEEFGSFSGKNGRITTPHSAFFYSPEIQDLQIRQTVNLLRHRNPHTGMTYAEDPAVSMIEIINEQSILFYTSMGPLKASSTLRRQVARRFSAWLEERYGSQEGLVRAWGKESFDRLGEEGFEDEDDASGAESLAKRNILPLGNPWYWDPRQLEGSQAPRRRRLLDTLEFLYGLQCEAYDRYVRAVREAGYEGEILGSNWQAGRAFSHYYNLHSDYRVGLIDRHNYFGGGGGGRIDNASMLRVPGSGMLSAGMQQVSDRPFMLSEWIHVAPTEWGVEGPAILGAYGMGLQGWDVSYLFQNRDSGGFRNEIGKDRWEVTTPQVLGVFPAVARQVLRGDVRQSEVEATRYVHVPSLSEGRLGFEDRVRQEHDVKTFDSDKVPARTLAVARAVVEFTDSWRDTPAFEIERWVRDGTLVSTTGQLRWTPGESKMDGFFTMDTPGTQAVVGFAKDRECRLGDMTMTLRSRFGALYVTARERDREIASAEALVIVAMARARNSGMKVFQDSRLLDRGGPPILLEPVKATLTLQRSGQPTIHVLDHDGCRTDKTLPVRDGTFEIDGARDRTCYYLVTW